MSETPFEIPVGPIKADVEKAVRDASNYLRQADNIPPIGAWLPTGIIRKLDELEKRWPYLPEARRKKCACVIQLCDVNRFFMNTFRIGLTAGTMYTWFAALPVIALIETLAHEVCVAENWCREGEKFAKCINILNSRGILKEKDKNRLHELRERRNDIHLYLNNNAVKPHKGKPKLYNTSVIRLRRFEDLLNDYYSKMTPGSVSSPPVEGPKGLGL